MLGMGKNSSSAAGDDAGETFTPVVVRARHDGWTPERQHAFIVALGESGCVEEACAAVRISARSAYKLRARPDASTFRQAWDVALDYAIRRLGDAALSRALHGVARPVFFKGEQIGERRHYDERLTMFLLRYRDPVRYGAWNDGMEARRHPDGAGIFFAHALNAVLDAAYSPRPDTGFAPPAAIAHGDAHDDADDEADDNDDGHDDDGHDPDPGAPRLARALAAGPPPPDRIPVPDYDGPEELRDLMERVRAATRMIDETKAGSDPGAEDYQQILPVRRPRRGSAPDVPRT
jgi:hypothetical protein